MKTSPKSLTTVAEYYRLFSDANMLESALERAHTIRQFEIELYWKRAAYFWTFIGVAFAGFFAVSVSEPAKVPDKIAYQFTIACIGFVFSLAWYLVNRGSKFWQENWERHIDLLEDGVTGPLQKTVLGSPKDRFSVSRTNLAISVYVQVMWLLLAGHAALAAFGKPFRGSGLLAVLLVTLGAIAWIWWSSRPRSSLPAFQGTTWTVEGDHPRSAPVS